MKQLTEATGTMIRPEQFQAHDAYCVDPTADVFEEETGCRLICGGDPVQNTCAVNRAAGMASQGTAGGTVLIPEGDYAVYTIRLQSHMTLRLCEGAVLRAAAPAERPSVPVGADILAKGISAGTAGQGSAEGQYEEPEVNLWAGLQDHGHTYFANSLVYGADLEDVCITGQGRFDGSGAVSMEVPVVCESGGAHNEGGPDTGNRTCQTRKVPGQEWNLQTWDPKGPEDRARPGHDGHWFGNKGIALVRCRRVALTDFTVLCGGHFAVIADGCDDLYAEGLLIDTNRDGFDIDSCQNVTVRNCIFNSVNDDALCLKSPCGSGRIRPVRNVLIEECAVSGYDCGSVYSGTRTCTTITAPDGDGPTGRVKFGTEATGGCDTVTVRRVRFERSRGFCLESCDGAPMHDILMEDCTMQDVSSSPLFLRVGDRGRAPVTGLHADTQLRHEEEVRLDHPEWVLPVCPELPRFPAQRYTPSYLRDRCVTVRNGDVVNVVNARDPCRLNPAQFTIREAEGGIPPDGAAAGEPASVDSAGKDSAASACRRGSRRYLLNRWNEAEGRYMPDETAPVPEKDLPLYANAVGAAGYAAAWNIIIRRLTIRGAQARYPILIHGLMDSRIRNILLEDIEAEFCGGLEMDDAVRQEKVNPFFCRAEARLPRADRDTDGNGWVPDPYNVPEMPHEYPEPSAWGILPACGLYVRHAEGITIRSLRIRTKEPDGRPAAVFDDVSDLELEGLELPQRAAAPVGETAVPHSIPPAVVFVRAEYRRPTGREYVPEYPFQETGVTVKTPVPDAAMVIVPAPAPGTPPDSLYPYETCPCRKTGYC